MKKYFRICLFTLIAFALFCGLYQAVSPMKFLGKISFYNHIFPGRERLPFGESPRTAYNFSLSNMDILFASHKISGAEEKVPGEFRVIVIGDSSSWGILLRPEETLTGKLDGRFLPDGRKIVCYNLAYPTLSLAKDLLLLDRALSFSPDLILWPLTLESFPVDKQENAPLKEPVFTEKHSFLNDRKELADWVRLQLYGPMWAGTGIDQDYSVPYAPPQTDLSEDLSFHGMEGVLPEISLSWELLEEGIRKCGNVPLLIINEPMLISSGLHSDLRYNFYYPKQTYDAWRRELTQKAAEWGTDFLDLWDLLPNDFFTNSAIHYNAEGATMIAEQVYQRICTSE